MLLVDMTPEQIRDVFKNHGEDLTRLEHAILVALDRLEWIEKRNEKAKSAYSLSKLTAGLPEEERGRVIDHAIRLMKQNLRQREIELRANITGGREKHSVEASGPIDLNDLHRTMNEIKEATDKLLEQAEETREAERRKKPSFLARLRWLLFGR